MLVINFDYYYKIPDYRWFLLINNYFILLSYIDFMIESLVDYVLERGNVDYGEFAPRQEMDQNSTLFNHRKLLQFLFENNETAK